MANYTKRQLMELIGDLPEDAHIAFVAVHDMIEGDIFIPLEQFEKDIPNADCFFISAGDPDELADIAQAKELNKSAAHNKFAQGQLTRSLRGY